MNSKPKQPPRNSVEVVKSQGDGARGTLAVEETDGDRYSASDIQHLKFHGVYQQDDRDKRSAGAKEYSFFVRTRLPGGVMTAKQLLVELDLCDRFGNGTLRLTSRQGAQIHGVTKLNLRSVIRQINKAKSTTWGACGDVLRNVMCCPASRRDAVHDQIRKLAMLISATYEPASQAYWELWLRDGDDAQKVAEGDHGNEPFYGEAYLPRKFKIGLCTPEDNCIDVLTHDLGFVAVIQQGELLGFNAYVGGGMGVTPSRADTFAAIAQPLAFVEPDEVLVLTKAIISVHRDFGNRSDRKLSRLRYLIAEWGLERFAEHVRRLVGGRLNPARELEIVDADDHLGWQRFGDQGCFDLGLLIPNGRIQDTPNVHLKSALREIAKLWNLGFVVTPHQNLLLTGIEPDQRPTIENTLAKFGVDTNPPAVTVRREAMACPALPTCGLAITESERVFPKLLGQLEAVLCRLGLQDLPMSVRMTGCPNGCTRPYVAEIGIVGKAKNKYSIFLGGSRLGTRLGFLYRDDAATDQVAAELDGVISLFALQRHDREALGDYCHRVGREYLSEHAHISFPSRKPQ